MEFALKALFTLATIVAGNGHNLSPEKATICRRLLLKTATVAEFGDGDRRL